MIIEVSQSSYAGAFLSLVFSKNGRVINVNPPAVSRRTFKVPGRGPAPLGRPLKEKGGKTQMIVTTDDDFIAMSDKHVKSIAKKSS